ncbi:hypothetical protein BJX61DRAFT_546495 [Aspergillus egyptiacus]|nr:hypothetical protein BJX61DRAFT_546495 [Aspergillus egyptiacus]
MADDDDRSGMVKIVGVVLLPVTSLFVVLRCYVRGVVAKAFGWDDGLMVLTMILEIPMTVLLIKGSSEYGLGQKLANLTAHQRVQGMKYNFIFMFILSAAGLCYRVSICIFLLRIAVNPIQRRILQFIILLVVTSSLVMGITLSAICKPVEYFWTQMLFDPAIEGSCNIGAGFCAMVFSCVSWAICDLALGIIPSIIVSDLQMSRLLRLTLAALLSLAGMQVFP